jgi:assimilatory nitrate reductase catalytic subunit
MSVNKETFEQRRDFNEDLQASGAPLANWRQADRLPDHLVPTHCCFCGVQCGMYLKVAGGEVIGVEPRVFPHNRGALCPKGVVAYQQVHHAERLTYPMLRRWSVATQPTVCRHWQEPLAPCAQVCPVMAILTEVTSAM